MHETMSLIGFHKFLIGMAILFSLGFAIRQLSEFRATGNFWALITFVVLSLAAAALAYYLKHLGAILKIPEATPGAGSTANSAVPDPLQRMLPTPSPLRQPGSAGDKSFVIRPGNGHDRSTDWAAPESGPETLPEKNNGHGD